MSNRKHGAKAVRWTQSRLGIAIRRSASYLVASAQPKSIRILMYHGVTHGPLSMYDWCQATPDEFEEQMKLLKSRFCILPLSEIVARMQTGKPLPPYPAAITFDDGLRNVYTTARPILQRLGIPASIFLVTSLIENGEPIWTGRLYDAVASTGVPSIPINGRVYRLGSAPERQEALDTLYRWLKALPSDDKNEQLENVLEALAYCGLADPAHSPVATMRWHEIEDMNRSELFEFGGHTHTHEILARCSPAQQAREIEDCAAVLRNRLPGANLFAYPNGLRADFTGLTADIVRKYGFRAALTAINGLNDPNQDLFALKRVFVGRMAPLWQFEEQLAGL